MREWLWNQRQATTGCSPSGQKVWPPLLLDNCAGLCFGWLEKPSYSASDPRVLSTASLSSVQSLSRVQLLVTPWTTARQASLSVTNSWSLLRLMSIQLVMPFSHLILCRPLLLLPSVFPSIRGEGYLAVRRLCYTFPCRAVILSLAKTEAFNKSRVL